MIRVAYMMIMITDHWQKLYIQERKDVVLIAIWDQEDKVSQSFLLHETSLSFQVYKILIYMLIAKLYFQLFTKGGQQRVAPVLFYFISASIF